MYVSRWDDDLIAGVMYLFACTLRYKYEGKSLSLSISVSMSVRYKCKDCTIYPASFSIRFSSDSKCLTCTPDSHADRRLGEPIHYRDRRSLARARAGTRARMEGCMSTADKSATNMSLSVFNFDSLRAPPSCIRKPLPLRVVARCRKMHGAIQLRAR
jgi:hypothetical protein